MRHLSYLVVVPASLLLLVVVAAWTSTSSVVHIPSLPHHYSPSSAVLAPFDAAPTTPLSASKYHQYSFLQSTLLSLVMILFSELGDKTFFLAALLAMRHPRAPVFLGACSALLVMSGLSAGLGVVLVDVLPRRWVGALAAMLFLVFGIKMAIEARAMNGGEGAEEMREVEKELLMKEGAADDALELGRGAAASTSPQPPTSGARNLLALLLTPTFVQSFVMVFLAEWGDRSQIVTIALVAAQDMWSVTLGTVLGHCMCTGLAVVGGRLLAERVSVKHVMTCGSALFLVFAVMYLADAVFWAE